MRERYVADTHTSRLAHSTATAALQAHMGEWGHTGYHPGRPAWQTLPFADGRGMARVPLPIMHLHPEP